MKEIPNGMGTWLAVFDHNGDLAGSISQRPNLMPILGILEENGDEIIENCDSIVAEIDMDKEIIKKLVQLCEKYDKKLYGVVSNMNIAVSRRDLLQKFDLPGDDECPDFYPLTADDGRTLWVYSGAHDMYFVGDFDENGGEA